MHSFTLHCDPCCRFLSQHRRNYICSVLSCNCSKMPACFLYYKLPAVPAVPAHSARACPQMGTHQVPFSLLLLCAASLATLVTPAQRVRHARQSATQSMPAPLAPPCQSMAHHPLRSVSACQVRMSSRSRWLTISVHTYSSCQGLLQAHSITSATFVSSCSHHGRLYLKHW